MKKNLLLIFLVLFALNSAVFANLGDPKKESEKPTSSSPKENKLSAEEISRLTRRAETDNLSSSTLSNKEKENNLRPPQEVYVTSHHHGIYYGGAVLILLIILIVVLV